MISILVDTCELNLIRRDLPVEPEVGGHSTPFCPARDGADRYTQGSVTLIIVRDYDWERECR